MKLFATLLLALALSGCASLNISTTPLAVATHNDLQAAAAYATAHGYPARAAVRLAIDAQLTACELAISAALPQAPAAAGPVGPITLAEMAEEALGNISGIPASVKINCAPVPIVVFPKLP
jgi:hypothetical protein